MSGDGRHSPDLLEKAKLYEAGFRAGIEKAARVADRRRARWLDEAEAHVNSPCAPGDVPPGWLRFKTKATEASELASDIRELAASRDE